MPCTDGGVPPTPGELLEAKTPAMLCAVLRVLENKRRLNDVLGEADWKAAGVTRKETLIWWRNHKQRDRDRVARETEDQHRAALRKQALAKLTPAERRALKT